MIRALVVELRAGETLSVSGAASIRLEEKSGGKARLTVTADDSVTINRPHKINSGVEQARLGVSGSIKSNGQAA